MKLVKVLGGLQDLLVKGFNNVTDARQKISQERNGQQVELNYLNIDTIPAVSQLGEPDFVSIRDFVLQHSGSGGLYTDYVTLDISGFNLSNTENDIFVLKINIDRTNNKLVCQNTDINKTVSANLIGSGFYIVAIALNGIILDSDLFTVTNDIITIDFNKNYGYGSPILLGPQYTSTDTLDRAFGYKHVLGIYYLHQK